MTKTPAMPVQPSTAAAPSIGPVTKAQAKQLQLPQALVARIWLYGDPRRLARFDQASGTLTQFVYGRNRSAFYTCVAQDVARLEEIARREGVHLVELDSDPVPKTTSRAKWWNHSRQAILDHFAPGQVFSAKEAARVLHTTQPGTILNTMVQAGLLERTGRSRATRYHVTGE